MEEVPFVNETTMFVALTANADMVLAPPKASFTGSDSQFTKSTLRHLSRTRELLENHAASTAVVSSLEPFVAGAELRVHFANASIATIFLLSNVTTLNSTLDELARELEVAGNCTDLCAIEMQPGPGNYTGMFVLVDDSNLVLSNVILRYGYSESVGGVIHLMDAASLVLRDCYLDSNTALEGGGALFSESSGSIKIINSLVQNCSATLGGVMYITGASPIEIIGSQLQDNNASRGGLFYMEGTASGPISILGSVFQRNYAMDGGAGVISGSGDVNITDCLFHGNTAEE
ncbi:hypothetical protein CYMTET_13748, partial [Cymbomonas tetramitiformis]